MNAAQMTNEETNDKAAAVAEAGENVAPERAVSKKGASQAKGAPKRQKSAKGRKAYNAGKAKKSTGIAREKGSAPRAESKGAKILEMIGRSKGATLAEIMSATGWQAHSVRGFISTAGKKPGIRIESSKNDSGDRVYRNTK